MIRKTEPFLGGACAVLVLLKVANIIKAPWYELIIAISFVVLILEVI